MQLQRLTVSNFRNLSACELQFSSGFNYVHGANGAGKTALLEAIQLLARGRSFRTHQSVPLIAHGEDELIVRADVLSANGLVANLAVSKRRGGQTRQRINGENQSKASALAMHLPVQTLLPDAANLIFGGPGERRGFIDWGLFHVEPQFLAVSSRYRRVLSQRNAWLKTAEAAQIKRLDQDPWAEQFLELAKQLGEFRSGYTESLKPIFQTVLQQLAPSFTVSLSYLWGGLESTENAEKKMSETLLRDVKFGVSHRGPHRADLQITGAQGNASESVSRGQAKLIASAALLAQARLQKEITDVQPLFLIDDFGAELDADHWQFFVETLEAVNCQVIATSTGALDENWTARLENLAVFHVEQGQIIDERS